TDGDGDYDMDTADIGSMVGFEDDGPSVEATGSEPDLMVDDSDFDTDDTDTNAVADYFDTSYGSDGPGSTTYSLEIENANSGLYDTLTGNEVILYNNAGSIEGWTIAGGQAGGGELVFTVSIVGGMLELDQSRAIVHTDNPGPDPVTDHDESLSLGDNVINLVAEIEDGDGDTDSAEVDLGGNLTFKDDGPTAELNDNAAPIVLDETDNDGDDGDVGGLLADVTVNGSSFYTTLTHGNDGEAATDPTVFSLILNAGASGLTDTVSDTAVVLSFESGDVVGRTSDGNSDEVFRIAVDADTGDITVTQSRALKHDDPNDPDENASPEVMNSGLVELMVMLTDGDGDYVSDTIDLGELINFEDDGPSIALQEDDAAIEVDESTLPNNGSDNFAGYFGTITYGSDGGSAAKTFSLTIDSEGVDSGLNDTLTDADILLYKTNTGTVEGRVGGQAGAVAFIISIDDVTAEVDFDQKRSVVHPNPNDDNEAITLDSDVLYVTATVTDGDGDYGSSSIDLGEKITILDDGVEITNIDDGLVEIYSMSPTDTGAITVDYGNDEEHGTTPVVFSAVDLTHPDLPDGLVVVSGLGTDQLILSNMPGDINSEDATTITFDIINGGTEWQVTVQTPPIVPFETNLAFVNPGSPEEFVYANEGGDANQPILVTFDGVFVENFTTIDPINDGDVINPGDAAAGGYSSTDDDLNANQVGFGNRAEQDSNFEEFGGFIAIPMPEESVGFRFTVDGIGNNNDATVHWVAYNDTNNDGVLSAGDGMVDYGEVLADELAGVNKHGGVVLQVTPDDVLGGDGVDANNDGFADNLQFFDFMVVWFEMDDPESNNGPDDKDNDTIRVKDFVLLTQDEIPDYEIDVTVTAMDGDQDTDDEEFTVVFDGNDFGVG
ncbi:DUF5801 domain-containing protein, partial [Emcibacteraceae bacterium Y4]